jgi:iron complex transport system substrate-binding protein
VPPWDVGRSLGEKTKTLALHAHDFAGMWRDLRELGEAVGKDPRPLERKLRTRLEAARKAVRGVRKKRVFCMEWLDPVYASGHWVPEMVEMAGGHDGLARARKDSYRVEWKELAAYAPEVLIIMPCGFTMERARAELGTVTGRPEWKDLPAVRSGQVWLVDGPSYFNGAGPRLIDGVEILAGILHPDRVRRPRRGANELARSKR